MNGWFFRNLLEPSCSINNRSLRMLNNPCSNKARRSFSGLYDVVRWLMRHVQNHPRYGLLKRK